MLEIFVRTLFSTVMDVLPIIVIILVFQYGLARKPPAHWRRVVIGAAYALLGLVLFRMGLEETLVPLGGSMAEQLVLMGETPLTEKAWDDHLWLILFAATLGLAATLIEPTLTAVVDRAQELTGGELKADHLRYVVAASVAVGLAMGVLRILMGLPISWFILPLVCALIILSVLAPKAIVPLALDTGPMATSIVVVPLVTAFGVAIANVLPGRDPLLDGFGLVFFALIMPVLGVQAFALHRWKRSRNRGDS